MPLETYCFSDFSLVPLSLYGKDNRGRRFCRQKITHAVFPSIHHRSFSCQVKTYQTFSFRQADHLHTIAQIAYSPADYIQALQACIAHGSPPDILANSRYHLDSSALWHEQYKKSEQSQIELRARISELESLHAAERASKQTQRKRKATTNEAGRKVETNARKRLKTPVPDPLSQSLSDSLKALVDQLGTSPLDQKGKGHILRSSVNLFNRTGFNFPHNVFILNKIASTRPLRGHELAIALSRVSSDVRLILSSIKVPPHNNIELTSNVMTRRQWQNSCEASETAGQDLETRLLAIGSILPCLHNAISQLTEGVQGAVAQPRVIHGVIGLLQDLFERLLAFAAENGESSPHAEYSTGKKPQYKAAFPLPDGTVMKLCRLVIRLVTSLDLRRAPDQKILDGFLYFLLGRTGAILRLFVFGPDSNEILHPNYENQTLKITPISYDEERKSAEAQAPYLIYILARIVPFAEEHRIYMTKHAAQAPQPSSLALKDARLSRPAFATLQSTLLAAVFGPMSSADFSDRLTFPLSNDLDTDSRSGSEFDAASMDTAECMADWFKAEVWRVLGWEVLGGKIAWDG